MGLGVSKCPTRIGHQHLYDTTHHTRKIVLRQMSKKNSHYGISSLFRHNHTATVRIDRDSKSFHICMSSFSSVFIFLSWFPFSSFQFCLCFGLRLQSVTELYLRVMFPFLPLLLMWSTSLLYLQLASTFRHVSLFCFNLGVSSNDVSSSVCIFNLHSLLKVPLWLVT
jgi:hypothetical protein